MEVSISFDTEKESIGDLKKLVAGLQELIAEKEGRSGSAPQQQQAYTQASSPQTNSFQQQTPQKTAGGGRVIPFKDMTSEMSSIFSGKAKKRGLY
ncbi:hypothetical protein HY643_01555 [Candidatus Woesearchaeota archaeon]|nr:hypothetical protein [Candidatus Woesearchaeota archaeon]